MKDERLITKKSPFIELPLKVILTEEGIDFFIKNRKRPHRFRMADNIVEYGFPLNTFSPAYLQRMIIMDYISKIEVSRVEFNSKRNEIIDITKLIVYTMLYKKFDDHIYKSIMKSPFIENWNRIHPNKIIDERSKVNENCIKTVLLEKEKEAKECFKKILEPVENEIKDDNSLSAEEKYITIGFADKYLNHLRDFIWYILICSMGMKDWLSMLDWIKDELKEYLERSKIAEYLSVIVMELASNAETANLQNYIKRVYNKSYIENILFNKELREKILQKLEAKGELLSLIWKIRSRKIYIGNEYRLQTILFNKEHEYNQLKTQIEDKKGIDLKKKSLFDFYSEIPEGELNTQLGLYYLSYLNEACKKLNIHLDSFVNQVVKDDLTVINLSLHFK